MANYLNNIQCKHLQFLLCNYFSVQLNEYYQTEFLFFSKYFMLDEKLLFNPIIVELNTPFDSKLII